MYKYKYNFLYEISPIKVDSFIGFEFFQYKNVKNI